MKTSVLLSAQTDGASCDLHSPKHVAVDKRRDYNDWLWVGSQRVTGSGGRLSMAERFTPPSYRSTLSVFFNQTYQLPSTPPPPFLLPRCSVNTDPTPGGWGGGILYFYAGYIKFSPKVNYLRIPVQSFLGVIRRHFKSFPFVIH